MQAKAMPPEYQGVPRFNGGTKAALAAVVETVRVAVPALAPVITTGLVEPKLKVGRSWALVGLEVIAAARVTLPVNPPEGVMVMVLVPLPPGVTDSVEADGATVTVGAALTVRATVVDAVKLPEVPVIVTVAAPMVTVLLAVSVSTLEPVVGLVAKAAVTPEGRPEAASVTLAVNPLAPVTVIVSVALLP
jgi:hypothetical protein